jgi:predicted RND superfamily exporter protein
VPDLTQEEIDTAWNNVYNDPIRFAKIEKLIQNKESIDKNGGKVIHMRSFLQFGLPL